MRSYGRFLRRSGIIPVLLILTVFSVYGGEVRITPENFWAEAASWPDVFTVEQIISASLHASGTPDPLSIYEKKYEALLNSFGGSDSFSGHDGDRILGWMYGNVLRSYDFNQTLMNVLIDPGTYNCVSSSILYMMLARYSGLDTVMIEVPDHAFCSVKRGEEWVDVETTTPFGFDPGVKKEFTDDFKRTGFVYVPRGNYSLRKRLNDKESVALILQNRMASLQRKGRYGDVTGLAVDRWTFVKNEETFKDMREAFRNYAAVLNNEKRYLEAFNFITEVSSLYGMEDDNRYLFTGFANNYLLLLLDGDDIAGAEKFVEDNADLFTPDEKKGFDRMVAVHVIQSLLNRGTFDEGRDAVEDAFDSGTITEKERDNYLYYLIRRKAVEISETSGYWDSYVYLNGLPGNYGNMDSVKQLAAVMYRNWEITVHNLFVDYVKEKDFDSAEKVLKEGLKKSPGSGILLKDLKVLWQN